MKKVITLVAVMMLAAGSAHAAGTALASGAVTPEAASVYGGVDATTAGNAPTPLIKFSTGVSGTVIFSNDTEYLIATKHKTGNKIFGTNNNLTNIYWKQSTSGVLDATKLGITSAADSSFVGSGWTSY